MSASRRSLALLAGVLAFAGAVAVLAGVVAVGMVQGTIPLVGILAVFAAVSAMFRRRTAVDRTETPDPERRRHVPVPGDDLLETVDQFRSSEFGFTPTTRRITAGLRSAAAAVLTRFEGLSADEARERIEDGTWTDDPHAAAFLSPTLEEPGRPLRERIAATLGRTSTFRTGVRRTAAAVASIGYGDRDGSTGTVPRYDAERESVTTRTTSDDVTGTATRTSRSTGYWTGIGTVALLAIGLGALAESSAVVLAGVVGVGYAGFARTSEPPVPEIDLERTTDDDSPEPGDEVAVTVTITNEGGTLLPDLRFVDGVPSGLSVTDGSARLGTALRPGESVTLEYTVTARRGRHTFDPALVLTRDLSRATERETLVAEETTLVSEPISRPTATPVPLRAAAATFAGRLSTADGGSGTEFHSVREYRKTDPLNRVDWNRHARTGDLATLEFHEERAARVLVLVDAREAAYLAPEPDAAHAVDRSVEAAGRIAASLLEDGDAVGLAALGPTSRPDGSDADEPCWLAPSSDRHHRTRLRESLAAHPQFSTLPPERRAQWLGQLRAIRRRLSAETQVVLLTPLCDQGSADVARRLDARGHAVTVVSPDPTTDRTTSQQLARVGRRIRRFDLQRAGVPVVDWRAEETIDEAFARTNAGGRR